LTGADATYRTDESYSYDANGNRTNANNANYQTGTNNQLTSDGIYTYTYDDEGNLKTRTKIGTSEVRTFTWDYRNRLVGVSDSNGSVTTYTYDVMDRRIAKTAAGSTTQFVYDGDNVILEFNGTATPSVRYLQGPGVDQVLAQESNNTTTWMLTDHLGTVRDLVNNGGSVVNHFTYDSFGKVLSSTAGGVDTRYKFTGREFDGETGLYYYRARYFDANVGRFIGQDPISFEAGDSNLYRYVENSSLNATDPSGKVKIELVFNPLYRENYDQLGNPLKPGQGASVNHAFIRVTDDCLGNFRNFYRGGPKHEFGTKEAKSLGFGPIVTKHGPYDSKDPKRPSKDYQDPDEQYSAVVYYKKGEPSDTYHVRLVNSLLITERARIAYKIQGPNSNSVAYQALWDIGIRSIIRPNGLNAPGWGINLRDSKLERWQP